VDTPPTQNALTEILSARLAYQRRAFSIPEKSSRIHRQSNETGQNVTSLEEYLEHNLELDYSATRALLERQGLHAPFIDHKQINRLIELAGSSPTHTCRFS
jgi:hypothetical protein